MVLHEIQKDVKPLTLQWNLCATRIHGQMECLSKTLALSTKPILRARKFFFELLSDENHTGDRIVWLAALRCIHGKHSRRVGTITQMLRNLSKYLCYLTEHGKSCHQSSILSVNFWVIPTSPRKDVLTLILSKKELRSDRDENPRLDNRLPRSNQTLLEDDGIHLWVTKDQWFKAAFAHTSVWKRCSLLLKKWLLLKKLVQG